MGSRVAPASIGQSMPRGHGSRKLCAGIAAPAVSSCCPSRSNAFYGEGHCVLSENRVREVDL